MKAGGDVEISTQAGVLLKPVFIVGLYPVDAAMLVGEPRYRAINLVVVFEVSHLIIICE